MSDGRSDPAATPSEPIDEEPQTPGRAMGGEDPDSPGAAIAHDADGFAPDRDGVPEPNEPA